MLAGIHSRAPSMTLARTRHHQPATREPSGRMPRSTGGAYWPG